MLELAIVLSTVIAGLSLYGAMRLLTLAWLQALEKQRKLRREFVEQLVDELAEIRTGFNKYLKHRAEERNLAATIEAIYMDFKASDPSLVAQGLALWLKAAADRLAPPAGPEVVADPIPELLLDWINKDSEEWARQGMIARAKELYKEFENWEIVSSLMTRESGQV